MRTKLILLLIFSSLTSLSYSQKLTQEDFQGLWYRIYSFEKDYDSLYSLNYEKVQFKESNYYDTLWTVGIDSINPTDVRNWRTEILSVINPDEYNMEFQFGSYQPLEVFEVMNNEITFFNDIFQSNLVYTNQERKGNKKKFEEKVSKYNDEYFLKTKYNLKENSLSIKEYNSDAWSSNEILYFYNDTMIIRNSKQNFYNVYIRKRLDESINYNVLKLKISCPEYTIEIERKGKIIFDFENSSFLSGRDSIKDGKYLFQISEDSTNQFFDILKYANLKKCNSRYSAAQTHPYICNAVFSLKEGTEIKINNFYYNGPVEIRVISEMIYTLVKNLYVKK